jgi:hypothetical protein
MGWEYNGQLASTGDSELCLVVLGQTVNNPKEVSENQNLPGRVNHN